MAAVNRKLVVLLLVIVIPLVLIGGVFLTLHLLNVAPILGTGDPDPLVARGSELMEQGQYEEALQYLNRANQITRGRRPDIMALLAECHRQKRPEPDLPRAAAFYDRARTATPEEQADKRIEYTRALAEIYPRVAGGYDRAVSEARRLTEMEPENPEHYRRLAQLHLARYRFVESISERKKLLEDANAAIDKAIETGPDDFDNYGLRISLLLRSDEEDAVEQIEQLVAQALERVEDKAAPHVVLGEVYRTQADRYLTNEDRSDALLEQAREQYKTALEFDDDNISALAGLGRIAWHERDMSEAERYFRQIVSAHPEDDSGYWYLTRLLRGQGKIAEAQAELQRVLDQEGTPDAEFASNEQGKLRYRILNLNTAAELFTATGDFDTAQCYVDRLKTLAPRNPVVDNLEGKIAFSRGDFREAHRLLSRAVEQQSARSRSTEDRTKQQSQAMEAQFRFDLALNYIQLNFSGKALDELSAAQSLLGARSDPGLTLRIRRERARLLMMVRDFDGAVREARAVLERVPNEYTMLNVLSASLLQQGQADEALAEARKAQQAAPNRAEGYLAEATILNEQGNPRQAKAVVLDALDRTGDAAVEPVLTMYRYLLQLYREQPDMADDLAALEQRIAHDDRLNENERMALTTVATTDPQQRLEDIERLLEEDPENLGTLVSLAETLFELDRREESLTALRKAYDVAVAQGDPGRIRRVWNVVWGQLLTSDDPSQATEWIEKLPEDMSHERRVAAGLIEVLSASSLPQSEAEATPADMVSQARLRHAEKAIEIFKGLHDEQQELPDVQVLRALARAHFLRGRLAPHMMATDLREAERLYLQIIGLRPQDDVARLGAATVYLTLQEPDRAVLQIDQILSRNPNNISALLMKAQAEGLMDQPQRAIATREAIRRLQPGNIDNLRALAGQYAAVGDNPSATRLYSEVLDAVAGIEDAEARLALSVQPTLALAQLEYQDGRSEQADQRVKDLGARVEDEARRLMLFARYYAATNRSDNAADFAVRAMQVGGDNREILLAGSSLLAGLTRFNEATTPLQAYLSRHPDDIEVMLQYCDILMVANRDLETADKLLQRVLTQQPQSARANAVLARVHLRLALKARSEGNEARAGELLDAASRRLQELLTRSPQFDDGLLTLGDVAYHRGNKAAAVEALGRLNPGSGVFARGTLRRAQINVELGDTAAARSDLRRVLSQEPENTAARLLLVELLYRAGDYGQAEAAIREGMKLAPESPAFTAPLIRVLLARGRADEARRLSETLTEANPDQPVAWRLWYAAMVASGSSDAALSRLRQLHEAYPDSNEFALLLAEAFSAAEQYDEGVKVLRGALGRHSDAAPLHAALFDTLLAARQSLPADASGRPTIDDLARAAEQGRKATGDAEVMMHRSGMVRELQGRWADAEAIWRELLASGQLSPAQTAGMRVRLGVALMRQDRYDEALKQFDSALESYPSEYVALNNRAWVLATEKNDTEAAMRDINAALRLMPDGAPQRADLLDTKGWIHFLQGVYPDAIETLGQAYALSPQPNTAYRLGRSYLLKAEQVSGPSDRCEAAAEAKKYLELYFGGATADKEYEAAARQARTKAETILQDCGNGS